MSDISNQLIKDSYNYVLQSDLSTGVVYRIGGTIPINPIFQSGLTVNSGFTYSNGTEGVGYALLTDGTGYAYWGPVSAATPSSGVTSITATNGLSGNVTTGTVTIINTAPDQTVTITGGTNIEITGIYPDFGINYTGTTTVQGITGITGTSGVSANTTNYGTTIINTAPDQTVTISGGTGITTGGTYPNFTIINSSPDQTVTVTGGTNIQITGTYPNFGVNFTGSTSGDYLPLSGGTVTGTTNFTNGLSTNTISATTFYNLPVSAVTSGTGISASTNNGTVTITNISPDQTVTISGGTGITTGGTYPNFTLVNSSPDQTVTITGGTNIQIISSYPNFGINFTGTTSGGLEYFVTGATPTATQSGDRWFNTDTGVELVWIEDGDSNQWVQPFSVPGPLSPDVGYYATTGITTGQTLTWDKTYWGISGSSNVNLTLPTTTSKDGYYLIIKDEAGICGTYRIRITPASGLIDGNNYVDMNINYMSLTCMVRGGNWYLI